MAMQVNEELELSVGIVEFLSNLRKIRQDEQEAIERRYRTISEKYEAVRSQTRLEWGERYKLMMRAKRDRTLRWIADQIADDIERCHQSFVPRIEGFEKSARDIFACIALDGSAPVPGTSQAWMAALGKIAAGLRPTGTIGLPALRTHQLADALEWENGRDESLWCRDAIAVLLRVYHQQRELAGSDSTGGALFCLARAIGEARGQGDNRFVQQHQDEIYYLTAYYHGLMGLASALHDEIISRTGAYVPGMTIYSHEEMIEQTDEAVRALGVWREEQEAAVPQPISSTRAVSLCRGSFNKCLDDQTVDALSARLSQLEAWLDAPRHLKLVQEDASYLTYAVQLTLPLEEADRVIGGEGMLALRLTQAYPTLLNRGFARRNQGGGAESKGEVSLDDKLCVPMAVYADEPTIITLAHERDGGATSLVAKALRAMRMCYRLSVPIGWLHEVQSTEGLPLVDAFKRVQSCCRQGGRDVILVTVHDEGALLKAMNLAEDIRSQAVCHIVVDEHVPAAPDEQTPAERVALQAKSRGWSCLSLRATRAATHDEPAKMRLAALSKIDVGALQLPLPYTGFEEAEDRYAELMWARKESPLLDEQLAGLSDTAHATHGEGLHTTSLVVGTKRFEILPDEESDLPWALDLREGALISIEAKQGVAGVGRDELHAVSHGIVWSFLQLRERMQVKVHVCDFVGRGNSIAPFLEARSLEGGGLFGNIVTGEDELLALLDELDHQIDDTTQKRLVGDVTSLVEYNDRYPRSALPLTLLVVYDFPQRMDARVLRALRRLLEGGRCGISVLLVCATDMASMPTYDDSRRLLEEISKACSSMAVSREGIAWNGEERYLLQPCQLPSGADILAFAQQMREQAEKERNQSVSFKELQELVGMQPGTGKSVDGLEIPVGIGRGDEVAYLRLGLGTSQHALVIGSTGSGKSSFFHTLILSGMNSYGPDQLQYILMDFKGTEFQLYETYPVPHVSQIAIDAMQVFGEGILEGLVSEMEERNRRFKEAGYANLSEYVKNTRQSMPRLLVLIDEFQVLYDTGHDRAAARHCAQLTDELVRQGRSVGIHLIMATQTMASNAESVLSSDTLEQLNVRVALRCGDRDINRLFGYDGERDAKALLEGPQGMVVMGSSNKPSDLRGFRFVFVPPEQRGSFLEEVARRYDGVPIQTKVFEGGRRRPLLEELGAWETSDTTQVELHFAEQVKCGEALTVRLDRMQHNLLICGSDEQLMHTYCWSYVLSALADARTRVLVVDGLSIVEEQEDSLMAPLEETAGGRLMVARDFDELFALVDEAYDAFANYQRGTRTKTILMLKDVQMLDDAMALLRGEEVEAPQADDYGAEDSGGNDSMADPNDPFAAVAAFIDTPSQPGGSPNQRDLGPAAKLATLAEKGNQRGVVVVVASCDPRSILDLRYGGGVFNRLGERLVFAMSGSDASALVDSIDVGALDDDVTYFRDRSRTVQVRPYRLPTDEELRLWLDVRG